MLAARFGDFDERTASFTRLALRQSGASVELRGSDGSSFGVELELHDGLMALGEVSRTFAA